MDPASKEPLLHNSLIPYNRLFLQSQIHLVIPYGSMVCPKLENRNGIFVHDPNSVVLNISQIGLPA